MAKLYVMDVAPLMNGAWEALLPLLSPWRQQRVISCRHDADRARLTGAGWLLRHSLEEVGIPAARQQMTTGPYGKPCLAGGAVEFSLSHSGSWAVCALDRAPVGVDVERPRCSMATARRFFAPAEVAALEAMPEYARPDALLRLWTAKEAFSKAVGAGLTLGLHTFTVTLTAQGATLSQQESPLPFRLEEYTLPGHRICLCTTGERPILSYIAPPRR